MQPVNIEADNCIVKAGDAFEGLFVIMKGSVTAANGSVEIVLERGDVVGAADAFSEKYRFTYVTREEVILVPYAAARSELESVLLANEDVGELVFESLMRQLALLSEKAKTCRPDLVAKVASHGAVWAAVLAGCVNSAAGELSDTVDAPETGEDSASLKENAASPKENETEIGGETEEREKTEGSEAADVPKPTKDTITEIPDEIPVQLQSSLKTILEYSGIDEGMAGGFRVLIGEYAALTDRNSMDEAHAKLRLAITGLFYQIYYAAFMQSLESEEIPAAVRMFLDFGYMDERLAGERNTCVLYAALDCERSNPEKGIYSIYEWLRAVYEGKVPASRNEFDNDYEAALHEQRVNGKITADQEKAALKDKQQRLLFEIQNMFTSANKMTHGHITTFCPVFSSHTVFRKLEDCMVSVRTLQNSLSSIRERDFGAFYRDTVYSNPEVGINSEYISVEVLPNIILLPNIGMRSVMWQEIEGKKRTTSARFLLPAFLQEDIYASLLHATGEYRWEMCKRIQGGRWNDVTDASLTSLYFDYVQFYKKNRDLAPDAKEKIKLSLMKAKNSYKEMFVRDYMTWVMFETEGSPRMNRVARAIMFTYCTPSKLWREKIKINPMYKDLVERYNLLTAQKQRRLNNMAVKLANAGKVLPDEIADQIQFLEK